MIDVANIDLCRELYALKPEWNDTEKIWRLHRPTGASELKYRAEQEADDYRFRNSHEASRYREENKFFSACDLGYLLRKCAEPGVAITVRYIGINDSLATDLKAWPGKFIGCTPNIPQREYPASHEPENCLAEIVIRLCKEGVL